MLNEYLQSGLKAAKGVYKSAKYQMEGLSEIEIKTRECTNSDPWGAHGKDLAVLARATHNREEMYLIMKTLWLRLEEREEKWRHCYKALNVIEYLVAHGHESCVKELKQNVRSIEYLDTFKFKDSSGRDQGINVRQKSATLVSLLRDDERIAEAREKARRNRGKYSGISADDVRSGSYNRPEGRGGSSYERDGRDGDRYASGDGWRDDRASRDGRDDYASRDRHESSRDRDNGDREFRAFSAAPAPAARAAPARDPAPPPFQADFGDFEDDTPAQTSASGYVPKVVLSPAPSAAPARVVALAPPPGTNAAPGSAQTAAGAGGLDELFAGMATSPAPAPAPAPAAAPADPFGDMFGAPAAPPAASSHAASNPPAAAAQAATPDLFSLDVPAAAPPPAMGGGGGLGAFGPAATPQMDLDQLYAAPPQMPARMGGMMGGVPQMQPVPSGFGAQQGMMGGAYAQQQNAMGGFGMQQSGMTAPMGGAPMGGVPMGGALMGGAPMGGMPMGGVSMGGMPMGGMPMGGMPMGGAGGHAQVGGGGFGAAPGATMGGFGAGAGATGSPGHANGGGGSLI